MTEAVQDQDGLVAQAEKDLKVAQAINPLNTDHTANLARLYSWWASNAKNKDDLIMRGEQASAYYATAVTLSPNNSNLWDEWAILFMQILGDNQEAFLRLQQALSLDDRYSFTLGLVGDYYLRVGNSVDDSAAKITAFESAAKYYQLAAEMAKKTDTTSKATFLVSLGNTYILLDGLDLQKHTHEYLQQATKILMSEMISGVNASETWKVHEELAKIYFKLGDKLQAQEYANQAIMQAPENVRSRLQDLVNQINMLP
jgi:tetratricopeptide (TPR) repeat protein